jgi:hypothetical protein
MFIRARRWRGEKRQQGCCSPREKKATLAGSVDVIPKRGWATGTRSGGEVEAEVEVEAEAELEVDEIVPGSLHCWTHHAKKRRGRKTGSLRSG